MFLLPGGLQPMTMERQLKYQFSCNARGAHGTSLEPINQWRTTRAHNEATKLLDNNHETYFNWNSGSHRGGIYPPCGVWKTLRGGVQSRLRTTELETRFLHREL